MQRLLPAETAAAEVKPHVPSGFLAAQNCARRTLAALLRRLRLQSIAELDVPEPSIAVRCSREHTQQDEEAVYSALDELGWKPNPAQLTRLRRTHDVVRLQHSETGARLVLIVVRPGADLSRPEAA